MKTLMSVMTPYLRPSHSACVRYYSNPEGERGGNEITRVSRRTYWNTHMVDPQYTYCNVANRDLVGCSKRGLLETPGYR